MNGLACCAPSSELYHQRYAQVVDEAIRPYIEYKPSAKDACALDRVLKDLQIGNARGFIRSNSTTRTSSALSVAVEAISPAAQRPPPSGKVFNAALETRLAQAAQVARALNPDPDWVDERVEETQPESFVPPTPTPATRLDEPARTASPLIFESPVARATDAPSQESFVMTPYRRRTVAPPLVHRCVVGECVIECDFRHVMTYIVMAYVVMAYAAMASRHRVRLQAEVLLEEPAGRAADEA